ncbi:MAG: SpoIID/LytB domain-containing protein [Verrucomicrobiota bacterium]
MAMLLCVPAVIANAASTNVPVNIRFVDSATGFAVQPDTTEAIPQDDAQPGKSLHRSGVNADGRATLKLGSGRHNLLVRADGYQPMAGEFEVRPDNQYQLEFQLDPIVAPREIQPDYVTTLHRANETVFIGFVADDKSGAPLADVVVRTEPSGRETLTDARGYFQIYVPVQTQTEATNTPARLSFTKEGFHAEVRSYLELWSEGDWVYRIRLQRGMGKNTVDERTLRRRSEYPINTREENPTAISAASAPIQTTFTAAAVGDGVVVTPQLASLSAHVRIPTNIRVLRQDGFTIDYISLQTYCQRSLPSEWIASWGSTGPGNSGTNSLLAGAVAIRTYAAGFVNSPDDVNYDICGTTSCQAYLHTASDSRTTAAVNATANWVMFKPGATRIGFKITEYSAENNQLGQACGDGFTAPTGGCLYDPVCTGELEFGHGRGMCQWGTARWASGRRMQNRVTGDSVTNGYPIQNWVWLCEHYYPDLVLVQGAPLIIGDDVKVLGTSSLSIRECPGGNITNGTLCPQVATKVSGSVGYHHRRAKLGHLGWCRPYLVAGGLG